jgi:hypothetical protein
LDVAPGYETRIQQGGAYLVYPCDVGFYNSNYSVKFNASCLQCPPDHYAAHNASSQCDACTLGKFQPIIASASCSNCGVGQYLRLDTSSAVQKLFCIPCPAGTTCPDGLSVRANINKYVTFHSLTGEALVYDCQLGYCTDCSGDDNPGSISPITGMAAQTCCASNRVTAIGNINPVCGQCNPGYSTWSGECVQCDRVHWDYVILFIIISWFYVYVFHKISQTTSSDTKIFLYYIQMVLAFANQTVGWLNWLSFFQFNFSESTQTLCLAPLTPIQKLISGIIAPAICFAELYVTAFLHFCCWKYNRSIVSPKSWLPAGEKWNYSPFVRTTCALLIFSYNSVVDATLKYFDCLDVDGVRVITSQPAIDCDSSVYKQHLVLFVVLLIVIVIGFPLLLFYLLIKNVDKLVYLRHKYGILYEGFRESRRWYEALSLVRRVLLLAIIVVLSGNRILTYSWLTFLNVAILIMHMLLRPFEQTLDNNMETTTLILLAIITTLLSGMESPLTVGQSAGLSLLIFVPAAAIVCVIVKRRIDRVRERRAKFSKERKQEIEMKKRKDLEILPIAGLASTGALGSAHSAGAAGEVAAMPSLDTIHLTRERRDTVEWDRIRALGEENPNNADDIQQLKDNKLKDKQAKHLAQTHQKADVAGASATANSPSSTASYYTSPSNNNVLPVGLGNAGMALSTKPSISTNSNNYNHGNNNTAVPASLAPAAAHNYHANVSNSNTSPPPSPRLAAANDKLGAMPRSKRSDSIGSVSSVNSNFSDIPMAPLPPTQQAGSFTNYGNNYNNPPPVMKPPSVVVSPNKITLQFPQYGANNPSISSSPTRVSLQIPSSMGSAVPPPLPPSALDTSSHLNRPLQPLYSTEGLKDSTKKPSKKDSSSDFKMNNKF